MNSTGTATQWLNLPMQIATRGARFDRWIEHAKFHATSDDRGYPTGAFDWQRFHAAMTDPKFKPCCGNGEYLTRIEIVEQFGEEFWQPFKEAFFDYLTTQRDRNCA